MSKALETVKQVARDTACITRVTIQLSLLEDLIAEMDRLYEFESFYRKREEEQENQT